MILAAGRGERMGALTVQTPKPLLRVGQHYLIEYAIANLKQAGISEIVINVAYRGEQIQDALGDGSRYGVALLYSPEPERLETGGGIFQALPLLGDQPFIVLSADVITDYPLAQLPKDLDGLAHLIMVPNPPYHPAGDFGLRGKYIDITSTPKLTFGNVSVLSPSLFANCEPGYFRLGEVLLPAITNQLITGEHYTGLWYNVGTPADLALANQVLPSVTL
jgi:MurNAc alpha-1-phosphate uridylyltransferase